MIQTMFNQLEKLEAAKAAWWRRCIIATHSSMHEGK